MRNASLAMAAIGLGLLGSGAAGAAEVSGSGHTAYVTRSQVMEPLGNGGTLLRRHISGSLLSDQKDSPLHLARQDCHHAYVMASETSGSGHGYCDAVDRDGDVWWLSFSGDLQRATWTVLGGTGKYQGMTGGGTIETVALSPDGRQVITWRGTLDLK